MTSFASAERVSIEIIHRQAALFQEAPPEIAALASAPNYLFILNEQRQIVFASRNIRELIPDKLREQLFGLRPGEALNCVRFNEAEGGCGTSEPCRHCGALQAILGSLGGRPELREFTLTRFIGCHEETQPYLALAMPLIQEEETFSAFAISPSGHAQARKAFEQLAQGPAPARPPKSNPAQSRAPREGTRAVVRSIPRVL